MSRVLVSILSENNIPNYLFIKQMKADEGYDKHMFFVTERVEEKKLDEHLVNALGSWGDSRRIRLDDKDFSKCLEKLREKIESSPKEDTYIVNLTGGTKVMSLAVYEAFKEKANSQFYYVTQNLKEIYDFQSGKFVSLTAKISLENYMKVYGLRMEADEYFLKDRETTMSLFNTLKNYNYNRFAIPELKNCQSLADKIDKRYYGGEWFEEFCYYRIKRDFDLDDDAIMQGVKLFNDAIPSSETAAHDNEIDVMFVKDNALYVVECKVGMSGYTKGDSNNAAIDKTNETIYKLAAISKYIGFRVNSYIFTLHKVENFAQSTLDTFSKRMRLLGLKGMVTAGDLGNGANKNYLKEPELR